MGYEQRVKGGEEEKEGRREEKRKGEGEELLKHGEHGSDY